MFAVLFHSRRAGGAMNAQELSFSTTEFRIKKGFCYPLVASSGPGSWQKPRSREGRGRRRSPVLKEREKGRCLPPGCQPLWCLPIPRQKNHGALGPGGWEEDWHTPGEAVWKLPCLEVPCCRWNTHTNMEALRPQGSPHPAAPLWACHENEKSSVASCRMPGVTQLGCWQALHSSLFPHSGERGRKDWDDPKRRQCFPVKQASPGDPRACRPAPFSRPWLQLSVIVGVLENRQGRCCRPTLRLLQLWKLSLSLNSPMWILAMVLDHTVLQRQCEHFATPGLCMKGWIQDELSKF